MRIRIEDQEFQERIRKTQEMMKQEGLDLLLAYGNEAEPQYVRYYSDYWPSFESAGVLMAAEGEPLLIIGPESGTFAGDVSRIPKIRKLLCFRESSEPEYPGAKLDDFVSVIREAAGGKQLHKMGIAGSCLITQVIYQALTDALPEVGNPELVKADLMVSKIRAHKSPAEIACMREAYRITQLAMKKVVEQIHAGMTENQVKGIAMSVIYEEGGEGEAYPFWILTGKGSNQAISRCRNKVIEPGDLVHIQIGTRYEGYASTMGRPVVIGKADEVQRGLIEAGLAAQRAILETARAGVNAGAVSDAHYRTLKELGYDGHILYGPCHGTGLMEGEYPWIESNSDYLLEEGMTFCTCVYLGDDDRQIGMRIEDGFLVTKDGAESFSDYRREVIEIL
ncbi:Xaa-Pro peptidase family protein [Lachnospiraceae bacterium ASD3451]|uniref:M24 family metallopeptidase n=1 Tax=Diplocloster agilis TaxID=2850323 RepID=UPI001DB9F4DC|nr:Xaa-Pro peptidase family protein [Diplocloster agilis]MBU9744137.1 Xaa-Pro peptidase family protein [Diplocloster agilis]